MKKEITVNNGKYRMVKKLGAGRFSSCWEGREELQEPVAIKVQKNKKDYIEMANEEIKLYNILGKSDNKSENLLELKEHFIERGGDVCMVFEKMDKTLCQLIEESDSGLSFETVKDITKQILNGVKCLHDNGIIHTDLKPENILVKELPDGKYSVKISDLGNAYLLKDVERKNKLMKQNVIERFNELLDDHKVEKYLQLVKNDEKTDKESQEFKRLDKHKDIREFKLLEKTDEVKEFKILDKEIKDSVGTTGYNCIESIIGASYGTPIDIWAVACIVFECLTNNYLFDPHSYCDSISSDNSDSESDSDSEVEMSGSESDESSGSGSDSDDEEDSILIDQMHLWLMTRTLGEIPIYVSRCGDFADDFFNSAGNIKRMPQFLKEKSISYTLSYDYNFDKDVADRVEKFMRPLLMYDPEKRINADEALKLEF